MSTEVLVIEVGQCGVQMGTALWESMCLEHGIYLDGVQIENHVDTDNISVFFQEAHKQKFVPRTIFVDSEPTVIDEIKNGSYRSLYNCEHLINSVEDSGNNYARGNIIIGSRCIKGFRRSLNKIAEESDHLNEVLIMNSTGGGTGSGLSTVLLQQMLLDYPKTSRIQFGITPSSTMVASTVEPYNAVFYNHSTMDLYDMSILFDNEALFEVYKKTLGLMTPKFVHLNRLISLMICSSTASMRFSNTLNSNISEMYTNLIPYPRIHYCIMRHAPIYPQSRVNYSNPSVEQITKDVFSRDYQGIKCDTNQNRYISMILSYRGMVSYIAVGECLKKHKRNENIKFVDWCPTGFKLGISSQCASNIPDSMIGFSDKSVTMMANTATIKFNFEGLIRKFNLLFSKRTFVHWFVNEGMEENEFEESRLDLEMLVKDYDEIIMSEDEMLKALLKKKKQKTRSSRIKSFVK